jgi:hypothetical protein
MLSLSRETGVRCCSLSLERALEKEVLAVCWTFEYWGGGSRRFGIEQHVSRYVSGICVYSPDSTDRPSPSSRSPRAQKKAAHYARVREKLNQHSIFDERALFSCNLHCYTLTVVFPTVHPRFWPTGVHLYTLTLAIS